MSSEIEKDGWDIPAKNVPNPDVESRAMVPAQSAPGRFPLIDNDPHIKRVFGYARPSDWAIGATAAAFAPTATLVLERYFPSYVTKGSMSRILRLNTAIGLSGAFYLIAIRSSLRFYGHSENAREIEMDMREMTDKAKRGESLYGTSRLSEYLQGVSSRNSRYSALFLHTIPMFNFVNHPYHGIDTAKYYQNAERELEEERQKGGLLS